MTTQIWGAWPLGAPEATPHASAAQSPVAHAIDGPSLDTESSPVMGRLAPPEGFCAFARAIGFTKTHIGEAERFEIRKMLALPGTLDPSHGLPKYHKYIRLSGEIQVPRRRMDGRRRRNICMSSAPTRRLLHTDHYAGKSKHERPHFYALPGHEGGHSATADLIDTVGRHTLIYVHASDTIDYGTFCVESENYCV
ncbi:hypothetical protein [Enterovirga sp. CN4-39]|uniref:hypothetical protein n=1 Tax=Enterovirga sp. CN4-39 TaxID=3400910 RepID=UPI003C08AF0F